jgi:hypothetical protein
MVMAWNQKALKSFSTSERRFGYRVHDFFPQENGTLLGAEVGVYEGKHAELMLTMHSGLTLFCVDMWELWGVKNIQYPDTTAQIRSKMQDIKNATAKHNQAEKRLQPFGNRAQIRMMESMDAAKEIDDGSLDFVYIDGDHSFEGVTRDMQLWYPKINSGGLLAGHDYNRLNDHCAMKRAVDAFAKTVNKKVVTNISLKRPGTGSCWVMV